MPDLHPLDSPSLWASELVGAQVVTRQGCVGVVAGLVMLPKRGVRAFRVVVPGAAEPPRSASETLLLPFDAVEASEAGLVKVQSADDVVPAFKLPSLLAHLTLPGAGCFGSAVRSDTGQRIGHLWDARVDLGSGELLEYLIGPTPQQDAGAQGVLTHRLIDHGVSGEFAVQHEDALQLSRSLEALSNHKRTPQHPPMPGSECSTEELALWR